MGSLKDALLKAGLKATTPPKAPTPVNAPNERAVIHKKKITETIEKVESTIAPAVKEVKEVVAKAEAEIAKAPKAKKAANKTTKK